jgi:hypothetical protein
MTAPATKLDAWQLVACGLLLAATLALFFVSIGTSSAGGRGEAGVTTVATSPTRAIAAGPNDLVPTSLRHPAPAIQPAPTRLLEPRVRLGCRARRPSPCG